MKKKKWVQVVGIVAIVLLVFVAVVYFRPISSSTNRDFDTYLDELFSQEVSANTINLHYTLKNPESYGIEDYKVTFGEVSTESQKQSLSLLENMKEVLNSTNIKNLSRENQITYRILEEYQKCEFSGKDFYYYQEILRPSTGIQSELPVLLAEYTFYRQQDVEDYLTLLHQIPEYFQQILVFEMEKANQGLFMSEFAAEDVIEQCENFLEGGENNYLLTTFEERIEKMEDLTEEEVKAYTQKNREVVENKVLPAYKMLINGIKKLKNAGVNQKGLCYLPQGKAYYAYLVKTYTGSDRKIDELQEAVKKQRNKDLKEAAALIRKNPDLLEESTSYSFVEQEPEQILEDLQEKMKKDFPLSPDTSFSVKYVHSSLEEYMAPAFYLSVPIDDISQNCIYVNRSCDYKKIKLFTTLAHEGFPGHLYQNVMERSQDFHPIRNLLGTSGYSEGWATYVEMLSYSYSSLKPELAKLLQKDQSALLSLYATADLGIHYEGWDEEKLKEFFYSYEITNEEAIQEIYHLIIEEPAHYLKYYIGYLEFLDLKSYAKELYGNRYSDYQFHEALMKMGPAQFCVLKEFLPIYYKSME